MELVKHTTRVVDKHSRVKITIGLKVQEETGIRYFDISATSRKKGTFLERLLFPKDYLEIPYPLSRVAKKFPDLKTVINLHQSDTLGQPPYFLDRGLEIFMALGRVKAIALFRITKIEYYSLISSPDQSAFIDRMVNLKVSSRWKKEASTGLKIMEKLCFPICSIDFNDQNPYFGEETPESVVVASVSDFR